MQSISKVLITLVLTLLVVGCGFQIRGQQHWPPQFAQLTVVSPDPTTVFMRELMTQLHASGVVTQTVTSTQAPVLVIENERLYREALTISRDARVLEFALFLEIQFSVSEGSGSPMLGTQTLELSRDYRFNDDSILASQREEELLERDLGRAMANQLLNEIARQTRQLP